MVKWTGHYVKKLRDADMCITLQNVKISLSADTVSFQTNGSIENEEFQSLLQLNELLNKNEDEAASGTF